MRYIGLDLGRRTCGVAISDLTGTIATAVDTVRFRENDLQKCLGIASAEEKNSISHRFRAIKALKEKLL
jgi:putative Holliday junction resolvase